MGEEVEVCREDVKALPRGEKSGVRLSNCRAQTELRSGFWICLQRQRGGAHGE